MYTNWQRSSVPYGRMLSLIRPSGSVFLRLLPFVAFLAAFVGLLLWRYPETGHDFRLFVPLLLEGRWHFLHQGLAVLRYAPHFCGGIALYGNPNDLYYSVTQLLSLVFWPFTAVVVSAVLHLAVGYAGYVFFGRDALGLRPAWRHAFALAAVGGGFYFAHVIVGHVNFLPFPLLGPMLWLLFDRRKAGMALVRRVGLFALLVAAAVYAGGHYVMVHFALLAAALLPLDLLVLAPDRLARVRQLMPRALLLAAAAVCIAASKLWAVGNLLSNLRYAVPLPEVSEGINLLGVVGAAFWAFPQSPALLAGLPWGLHENTFFMSHAVLVGLGAAVAGAVRGVWKGDRRMLWFLCILVLTVIVFVEIGSGSGPVADVVYSLPVFSSFRVATRFLFPLTLLLTMVAFCALDACQKALFPDEERLLTLVAVGLTVGGFVAAYAPTIDAFELFAYDTAMRKDLAPADRFLDPVRTVRFEDYRFDGTTTRSCRFETAMEVGGQPQWSALREGPVSEVWDGAFNMMNPSCYQYPGANGCLPGDRIRTDHAADLGAFTSGRPVSWKVPATQRAADVVSLLALALAVASVLVPMRVSHKASRVRPKKRSKGGSS